MRKLAILVLVFAAVSYGSQRMIVAEQFTATWCTYCPGSARALFELYDRTYDTLAVIAYHSSTSDPYYSAEAASRATYYSLSGYPTCWFDGTISEVGGMHYGTMYPFFRHHVATREIISSPLEIALDCAYDTSLNTGAVGATITNTSASDVTGTLHFVVVENNITYSWQGMTKLEFVMRDMLPTASGESVTIPAGDTIMRSRNFTIGGTWIERECKIIVFVQASNRQIYQGAQVGILPNVDMDYSGLTFEETSGDFNRVAQPGESILAYITAKNSRDGSYDGSAAVSTSDPYITITSSVPQSVTIGPGDVDTVLQVYFDIDSSCPSPQTVQFHLDFDGAGDTSTFNFIVTNQPGFSDNIESGQGSWTHSGIRDYWHITEHKANSATHSWYSGVEGSWQYTNENDASLISPYFVATPDSSLSFYHQHALEPAWDFSYIEVDNGSGFWKTCDEFNGTQSTWAQETYALTDYTGQTIRLRFRFISDYSTVAEGWYVDDVMVPILVGMEENGQSVPNAGITMRSMPSLFSKNTVIHFQISDPGKQVRLDIYDNNGRLVKHWDYTASRIDNQIVWTGIDGDGRQVNSGIYFVRLTEGENKIMTKVIRVK